jgi:hypothetical protein
MHLLEQLFAAITRAGIAVMKIFMAGSPIGRIKGHFPNVLIMTFEVK